MESVKGGAAPGISPAGKHRCELDKTGEGAGRSKRGRSGEVGTRMPGAWDSRQGPVTPSCTQRAGAK